MKFNKPQRLTLFPFFLQSVVKCSLKPLIKFNWFFGIKVKIPIYFTEFRWVINFLVFHQFLSEKIWGSLFGCLMLIPVERFIDLNLNHWLFQIWQYLCHSILSHNSILLSKYFYSKSIGICSVFQTEVLAIQAAVKIIVDKNIHKQRITLLSHSQAAIKALDSSVIIFSMVYDCRRCLNEMTNHRTLWWILYIGDTFKQLQVCNWQCNHGPR